MVDESRRRFCKGLFLGAAYALARPYIQGAEVFASEPERPVSTRYAVLVRKDVQKQRSWGRVIGTLKDKYPGARVIVFNENIEETRDALMGEIPTHVGYVERPESLAISELPNGTDFEGLERERQIGENSGAGRFSRLLSNLNDTGYRASVGGIITGMTPEDALRLASAESLRISYPLFKGCWEGEVRFFPAGITYSEGLIDFPDGKFVKVVEKKDKKLIESKTKSTGPDILDRINSDLVDAMFTTWHASYRDWEIGVGHPDGRFVIDGEGGIVLTSPDGSEIGRVESDKPKVMLPIANCQGGRIKSRNESYTLSWIHSGGAVQRAGYIVNTWHGFAGWALRGHLFASDNPTVSEAVHMNTLGLRLALEKLQRHREEHDLNFGTDEYGKVFDQHVFAVYGDPGLDARVDRDPAVASPLQKTVEVGRKGDKQVHRFRIRTLEDYSIDRSFPSFRLPKNSMTEIGKSSGLNYKIVNGYVIFDIGNEIVEEGGAPKLVYPTIPAGTEWWIEFS